VVGDYQDITIEEGYQRLDVKGSQDVTVQGDKQWYHIKGTQDFDVGGNIEYAAEEKSGMSSKLGQSLSDATKQTFSSPWQEFKAIVTEQSPLRWQEFFSDRFAVKADTTVEIHSLGGTASLYGQNNLHLGSSTNVQLAGGDITISGGNITVTGGTITVAGGDVVVKADCHNVTVDGANVSINGTSGTVVKGGTIKLNC
jgi:hypothetical protein